MPLLEEAAQAVYPVYADGIRVTFVGASALTPAEKIPAGILDRLRAAFAGTDQTALAGPALRVAFASTVAPVVGGPGRLPGTFDELLRSLFVATDTGKADGAPALRVTFV
jgi:hypothetical protein